MNDATIKRCEPHAGPTPSAPRRPAVFALIAISGLSPFAINSVVPSMPAISLAFDAPYARVQLMLSAFLASVAIAQIIIGPLSDRFGRRPVLLGGFLVFVAVTALAPAAPSIDVLIAIRIVQGASGCVGIVLSRAIVRDLFERRQAASMLGYVTMGLAVAPMVAPTIGGLLQAAFGWTSIFWFTAILGACCIAVAWVYVPETNMQPTERLSFATVFGDFGALVRNVDFVLFTASSSLTTGVFFAFMGGTPYVSERILDLSPAIYGLWFAAAPVGYVAGNYLAGRFTEHFGVARMILAGSALALLGAAIPFILFSAGMASAEALFLPMILVGIANGVSLPSAISGAVSVRPDIAGSAAGLSGAAQMGVGAAISAVAGAVLTGQTSATPMFLLMLGAAALALIVALVLYPRNRPQA